MAEPETGTRGPLAAPVAAVPSARRHGGLRRLAGAAAVVAAGGVLAGCVHVGEDATVASNGTVGVVMTMTLSPAFSSLTHEKPGQALGQLKTQSKTFPGKVAVSSYTDPAGWKGIKISVQLKDLAQLTKLETMSTGKGSGPTFSAFDVTRRSGSWTLSAKLATSPFVSGGKTTTTNPFSGMFSKQALQAMGMTYVIGFRFPGRPVSDNATVKEPNGMLLWDMFKLKGDVLRATWASG